MIMDNILWWHKLIILRGYPPVMRKIAHRAGQVKKFSFLRELLDFSRRNLIIRRVSRKLKGFNK
jgi:hypothetical protein